MPIGRAGLDAERLEFRRQLARKTVGRRLQSPSLGGNLIHKDANLGGVIEVACDLEITRTGLNVLPGDLVFAFEKRQQLLIVELFDVLQLHAGGGPEGLVTLGDNILQITD